MFQWKLPRRQPAVLCPWPPRHDRCPRRQHPCSLPDPIDCSSLRRIHHCDMHAAGRCHPRPHHRSRLRRQRHRMVCRLCESARSLAKTRSRPDPFRGGKIAGHLRARSRASHGSYEIVPARSRTLHALRMDRACYLDRHRRRRRLPESLSTSGDGTHDRSEAKMKVAPPSQRLSQRRLAARPQLTEDRVTLLRSKVLFVILILSCAICASAQTSGFDLVITNGHIIDGTGSPWYSGDIGVRDGKIAAVGNLSSSTRKRTIDASGKVVAPGFIDMLGQSERTILVDPRLPSKIYQGITTEITGEGGSIAPLNDAIIQADRRSYDYYKITPDWRTFREYFARLERQGLGINLASYVGATQVRRMILGEDDKQPTPDQLEQMKALVRGAMRDGAVGVSTSLEYAPAPYAKTEELIALAAEAGKLGGIYASHIRDEGDGIFDALDEAFCIGREAKIPVEIWHLKAAGKSNWGRMPQIIARIEQARREGVDVAADTYAYPAAFNSFSAVIPPWAHDGGDKKLIERLKDLAMRARIRKEMETPSNQWNNEWQQVKGPESFLLSAVQ